MNGLTRQISSHGDSETSDDESALLVTPVTYGRHSEVMSEENPVDENPVVGGSRSNGIVGMSHEDIVMDWFAAKRKVRLAKGDANSQSYEPDECFAWNPEFHPQQRKFEPEHSQFDRTTRRSTDSFRTSPSWFHPSAILDARRWWRSFLTGVYCAIIALLVSIVTDSLTSTKFDIFHSLVAKEKAHDVPFGTAIAFLLFANVTLAIGAGLCVWYEPMATGSGIPEVKCFLNGVAMPRLLSSRALAMKALGIALAVAAGLPLGKEGPMVHVGAAVANVISENGGLCWFSDTKSSAPTTNYTSNTVGSSGSPESLSPLTGSLQWGEDIDLNSKSNPSCPTGEITRDELQTDREKRDLVTCGSACGVAAAFGAPIGGVLFALEETASFWSARLTWRAFFCALTTTTVLSIARSVAAASLFTQSDTTAMFSFGEFYSLNSDTSNYSVWELILFLLIGAIGGVLGAGFCGATSWLYRTRQSLGIHRSTAWKICEIACLVVVVTLVSYGLCVAVSTTSGSPHEDTGVIANSGDNEVSEGSIGNLLRKLVGQFGVGCTPLPADMDGWGAQERRLVKDLVPLYCDADSEYNELASLFLTDADTATRQLFHFREIGRHTDERTFSTATLLLFSITYCLTATATYGIAVPAGIFVPSLFSGAAIGRMIGHILHRLDGTHGTFADSGTYALIGAAAIAGGVARLTVSLAVMILEATGDMQYVLPLMLTILGARSVGAMFSDGIYEVNLKLRCLPFLPEEEEAISSVLAKSQAQLGSTPTVTNSNFPALSSPLPGDPSTQSSLVGFQTGNLKVSDVMSRNPVVMALTMSAGDCYDFLRCNRHHAYPVVAVDDGEVTGRLVGSVSRKVLILLLRTCVLQSNKKNTIPGSMDTHAVASYADDPPFVPFSAPAAAARDEEDNESHIPHSEFDENDLEGGLRSMNQSYFGGYNDEVFEEIPQNLSWQDVERFSSALELPSATFPLELRHWQLDLSIYVDPAPHVIHEHSSLSRTYRLFRTLGLRHLFVIDHQHSIKGLITREDLVAAQVFAEKRHERLDAATNSMLHNAAITNDSLRRRPVRSSAIEMTEINKT